jgi:uncharacterized membrane protein
VNEADSERLAALAAALGRLERRQDEILARLERLEGAPPRQFGQRPPAAPPPPVPPPPHLAATPPPVPPPLRPAPPPAPAAALHDTVPLPPLPRQPEPTRGFEARMGLMWVNRIGVVTLVLGAAFFFKYAVDSGWIGVWSRLFIGAAAGLAALGMGERLRRGEHRVYAQGVAAAGIGILYLTIYAAFALYGVVARGPGFLLMAAVTAAAGGLAIRHGSLALAVLGLAGGYATPVLIGGGQPAWLLLAYMLLLNAAAVYLSRARAWEVLEALALAGTAWIYGTRVPGAGGQRMLFSVFLLSYWGLGAFFASQAATVATQFLSAIALAGVWQQDYRGYFTCALLIAGGGLAAADRRDRWPLLPPAVFWFTAWIASHGYPGGPVFWFLTAAFVLFFAWAPWRAWGRHAPLGAQDLAMLAVNAGMYFALAYGRLGPAYPHWRGPLAVLLATAHMTLAWKLWPRDSRAALFSAGLAWTMLVLAVPAQFSGYHITQVWALEGAALAWIGARLRERRALYGSLAVFALAIVRLLFVDSWMYGSAWNYTTLVNARLLTFLLAAACLWAAAWWGRTLAASLAPYVAGHFVALWGLSLEALGWTARTAENVLNAGSAALSILLAAYALALVGAGVSTGVAVNRALGLGLIGVVVLKLYLWDVWSLGLFYRMAAFAALGVLLLAMSYLFSRRQWRAG